jgi:hypothetical protein
LAWLQISLYRRACARLSGIAGLGSIAGLTGHVAHSVTSLARRVADCFARLTGGIANGIARLSSGFSNGFAGLLAAFADLTGGITQAFANRLPRLDGADARRAARSARLFLQLLHEVGMVLFNHLAELLDILVLRMLLTELSQCDLLVVVDNQQRDDARLDLTQSTWLSRLTDDSAGLSRLARLSEATGLAGLSCRARLGLSCRSGLSRLSLNCARLDTRLRNAGLSGLHGLCEEERGAA